MESIAKIRRMYYVEKLGFKTIAKALNLSKNTVKKIIRFVKKSQLYSVLLEQKLLWDKNNKVHKQIIELERERELEYFNANNNIPVLVEDRKIREEKLKQLQQEREEIAKKLLLCFADTGR